MPEDQGIRKWPFLLALIPLVLVLPAIGLMLDEARTPQMMRFHGVLQREQPALKVFLPASVLLTDMSVAAGDQVFAGQRIGTIDPSPLRARRSQLRRDILSALFERRCLEAPQVEVSDPAFVAPMEDLHARWDLSSEVERHKQSCFQSREESALAEALTLGAIRRLEERERILAKSISVLQPEAPAPKLTRSDLSRLLDLTLALNLVQTELETARAARLQLLQDQNAARMAQLEGVTQRLASLLAELEGIGPKAEDTRLFAPAAGQVYRVRDAVIGASRDHPTELLSILPDAPSFVAEFDIPAAHVPQMALGSPARLTLMGLSRMELHGKLIALNRHGPGADVTARVSVELPQDDDALIDMLTRLSLPPGAAAEVDILLDQGGLNPRLAQLLAGQGRLPQGLAWLSEAAKVAAAKLKQAEAVLQKQF